VQVTIAEKSQIKLKSLNEQKYGYLIHIWSDKAFKYTVAIRALPSLQLHGGSLERTLSVPETIGISKGPLQDIFWSF